MGRFDTVLMGRRSYEASIANPGGPAMPGVGTYVFSRTLRPEDHPGVTIVNENLPATLATLRQTPSKDIWLFGGGELFRSLLQLGEVDRIEVGLAPVLLGNGIPFLPGRFHQIRVRSIFVKANRLMGRSQAVQLPPTVLVATSTTCASST